MRRILWFAAAAAVFAFPLAARSQQTDPQKPIAPGPPVSSAPAPSNQASSQDTAAQTTQSPVPQQDSLAAAARRARKEKGEAAKPARVYDNDNMPAKGTISTVGNASEEGGADNSGAQAAGTGPAGDAANAAPADEKSWRARFAKLRDKLAADQQDLQVMQRELSVLDVVMYPDPQKTLQQETTRGDINKKTADIDKQKKKIADDQQAIADAEDELRKSGGDSGWAR
jgi:hypothetical protein